LSGRGRQERTGADSNVTTTSRRDKGLARAGFIAAVDHSLPVIELFYYLHKGNSFQKYDLNINEY